jgi:hypothetical protein
MRPVRLIPTTTHQPSRGFALANSLGVVILLTLLVLGCSRAHYRTQADRDASRLIHEKANHPHWANEFYHALPRPDSRMFDPFDPDHEPLPPDDPAAHKYMHHVDGKKGWKHWHRNGDTPNVQNPEFLACLPLNGEGVLVLNAEEAVRQGFLHSPNYQRQMEEVYLSALDVSFERFRFDAQFFAGYSVDYVAEGRNYPGNNGQSQSFLTLSTFPTNRGVGFNRLFASGGELVVGLANSLVWQFSGPNDYQGNTLIDFSLVQPLLRDAGRQRVLERLTRSERLLLYNVRAMERFRQAFYVQVLTGRDPGQGPNRSGGVFGGAGLEGFTGTGGGGFGNLNAGGAAAAGAGAGGQGAGAQQAGGYLGLLQVQQEIRNQEDNIVRLRDNVQQLETSLLEELTTRAPTETILRLRLQVAQARQALLNAQSRLLNTRNGFEATLDAFKVTLGLPPQICVRVEDDLISDFELIDRSTNALQRQIQEAVDAIGETNRDILETAEEAPDPATGIPRRSITWNDELRKDLENLTEQLTPVAEFCESLRGENLGQARSNIDLLKQRQADRKTSLRDLRARFESDKQAICALLPVKELDERVFDASRFDNLPARLEEEYARLETQFATFPERVIAVQEGVASVLRDAESMSDEERFSVLRDTVLLAGQNLLIDLRFDVLALQLLQARAKTETISLAEVDMRAEWALEVARRYRHDWMNARAALVDQWRLIEFNANQLEASLDVVFSGELRNVGQNPVNLSGSAGRLRAGLQFDSPINRVAERNVYRQTLIEYQQARRTFYQFEDNVARGLRQQLRTVAANQLNFELQRFAVLQAAEQITLNDDIRAHQEATGQAAGATSARDVVSALSDLLDAQNNFMSVYVNYEVLRRQLDLDLGTMQLDPEGRWLDPKVMDEDYGRQLYSEECELPPPPFTDDQVQRMIDWFDQQEAAEAAAKAATDKAGDAAAAKSGDREELPPPKSPAAAGATPAARTKAVLAGLAAPVQNGATTGKPVVQKKAVARNAASGP